MGKQSCLGHQRLGPYVPLRLPVDAAAVNLRLRDDPLGALIGVLMALLLGLLEALPIGIVAYLVIRLAMPRALFPKGSEMSDCGSDTEK